MKFRRMFVLLFVVAVVMATVMTKDGDSELHQRIETMKKPISVPSLIENGSEAPRLLKVGDSLIVDGEKVALVSSFAEEGELRVQLTEYSHPVWIEDGDAPRVGGKAVCFTRKGEVVEAQVVW